MNPLTLIWSGVSAMRFARRTILRHKTTYLWAAGNLALGIGMSVAVFSLVNAVLLRPLPYPKQESIYVIWKADPLAGSHVEELAYPELRDLKEGINDFEYVAALPTSLYGYAKVLQTKQGQPVQLESAPVSHDFFRVLGVSPTLGRDFNSSDEHVGAAPVVLVSDQTWRLHLGSDPNIIGKMIRLNGQGYTVIGVVPRGVEFPRGAELWTPLGVDERVVGRRGATFLQAIARVKQTYSRARVAKDVNALFEHQIIDYAGTYSHSQQGVVTPLIEYWTGSARVHLWIMLAASLLLFLASTVSSGNLLLSRTVTRRSEIATHLAAGATRFQVLSQLSAESIAVGITATLGGLVIAQSAIRILVRLAPADIPRLAQATLDSNTFYFAAAAATTATLVCAGVSACWAARMQLASVLNQETMRSSMSRRTTRIKASFTVLQAAVTVSILAAAILLISSYRSMVSISTGFANRDALTMNLQLRGPGLFASQNFDSKVRRAFYTRLLNTVRKAPGVTSAAAVLIRPLEGQIGWDVPYEFEFEAGRKNSTSFPKANYEAVTPDYFRTVGTRLLAGRDFTDRDTGGAEGVVIISKALADHIRASGHAPIGHRLHLGLNPQWLRIVGVCANAHYRNLKQNSGDIFVSYLQVSAPTNYVVIRGTRPSQELSAIVRRALAESDSSQAIGNVATIGELIDRNTARHRYNMMLLFWFGLWAAILAVTGIYSLIVETVVSRKREIAIRIVLGAQNARLALNIVLKTSALVLLGEVLGVASVCLFGKSASELLYGVSAHDPIILSSVAVFVFVLSFGAGIVPACKACNTEPNSSLRTAQ